MADILVEATFCMLNLKEAVIAVGELTNLGILHQIDIPLVKPLSHDVVRLGPIVLSSLIQVG